MPNECELTFNYLYPVVTISRFRVNDKKPSTLAGLLMTKMVVGETELRALIECSIIDLS